MILLYEYVQSPVSFPIFEICSTDSAGINKYGYGHAVERKNIPREQHTRAVDISYAVFPKAWGRVKCDLQDAVRVRFYRVRESWHVDPNDAWRKNRVMWLCVELCVCLAILTLTRGLHSTKRRCIHWPVGMYCVVCNVDGYRGRSCIKYGHGFECLKLTSSESSLTIIWYLGWWVLHFRLSVELRTTLYIIVIGIYTYTCNRRPYTSRLDPFWRFSSR
jgi:hypothetical protein